jgi:hypothetical protein
MLLPSAIDTISTFSQNVLRFLPDLRGNSPLLKPVIVRSASEPPVDPGAVYRTAAEAVELRNM